MKLSEIAKTIADAEPGRDADVVHTTLRNPTVKAMLSGEAGRLPTSAGDYPPIEVLRARIFVAVHDAGLNTSAIAAVDAALRSNDRTFAAPPPDSAKVKGGWHYTDGLDTIVRGTKAGEDWFVVLRTTLTPAGPRVSVTIQHGWPESPTSRVTSVVDRLNGDRWLGTLVLPASDFLRPLIEAIG